MAETSNTKYAPLMGKVLTEAVDTAGVAVTNTADCWVTNTADCWVTNTADVAVRNSADVVMFGFINDTTARGARLDGSTHSMQTITYEHHEIHSGSHYFVRGVEDLGSGNVLDFTWQMPNTTKWIHWTWNIDTESEVAWNVYEGVTVLNALSSPVTAFNSNRNSANTSGTIMRYEKQTSLVVANTDTSVVGATLLSSGISGAGKSAGRAERGNELIMKQNTLYCLRAVANAAGYINFTIEWYEHTDKN